MPQCCGCVGWPLSGRHGPVPRARATRGSPRWPSTPSHPACYPPLTPAEGVPVGSTARYGSDGRNALPRGAPPPAPYNRQTFHPCLEGHWQRRPVDFALALHLGASLSLQSLLQVDQVVFLLRRPMKPRPNRPAARSGNAAGKGTGATTILSMLK